MSKEIKDYMKKRCESGYEYYQTTFDELALLLKENACYSPFKFKEGYRNNDNVEGSAKFVVLDIDECKLTDYEAHLLLEEYNHHIARTSDVNNAYKFRILLELNSLVDVDNDTWKLFNKEIGIYLGFTIDSLPKSSIYFSYAGRKIYSQTKGVSLPVKSLLDSAIKKSKIKSKTNKNLTSKEQKTLLDNPMSTFEFAFNSEKGNRSINIYKALMYAIRLNASKEYVKDLAYKINDYLVPAINVDRLENTLINPIIKKM